MNDKDVIIHDNGKPNDRNYVLSPLSAVQNALQCRTGKGDAMAPGIFPLAQLPSGMCPAKCLTL